MKKQEEEDEMESKMKKGGLPPWGRNYKGRKWEFYGLFVIMVEKELWALIGGTQGKF